MGKHKDKRKKSKREQKKEYFDIVGETRDLLKHEELARFKRNLARPQQDLTMQEEAYVANTAAMVSYGFLGLLRNLAAAGISDESLGHMIRFSHEETKKACLEDFKDIEGMISAYNRLLDLIAEEKPFHGLGLSPDILEEHRSLTGKALFDLVKLDEKKHPDHWYTLGSTATEEKQ